MSLQRLLPLVCLLMATHSHAQVRSSSASLAGRERQRFLAAREHGIQSVSSNNYDVRFYRCNWTIEPPTRAIKGKVTMRFTMMALGNSIQLDFNKAMVVDSVVYHNGSAGYNHTAQHALQLIFPTIIPAAQTDSVSIFYHGEPPDANVFFVGYRYNNFLLWTLSEPYGASTWWPCKDVLLDKADSIEISVTAPGQLTTSSNGVPLRIATNGNQKTSVWAHHYPIAAYLVAIAVANYTVTSDMAQLPGRQLPLRAYAYPEASVDFNKSLGTAKFCIERFSDFLSQYPFALEQYAQTEFTAGGGMEHQTNSFITSSEPSLAAHELAHQWFGDKVTCASWRDLWLNEGFASYMEYVYAKLSTPVTAPAKLHAWLMDITSEPGGSVYIADTLDEGRLFNYRLTYEKGAYVVHMLRWKLGDSVFFRGLRRYLNDPALAYRTAYTTDLQRNLQEESGMNLQEFFNDWVYGEGFPSYSATWSQQTNNTVQVTLNQIQSHPSVGFFEMPVPLLFRSAFRDTIIRVEHTYSGQSFTIDPGFPASEMVIDPDLQMLARSKIVRGSGQGAPINRQFAYPNPVRGTLYVNTISNFSGTVYLALVNSVGQQVYVGESKVNIVPIRINTASYPPGIYSLMVVDDTGNKGEMKLLFSK